MGFNTLLYYLLLLCQCYSCELEIKKSINFSVITSTILFSRYLAWLNFTLALFGQKFVLHLHLYLSWARFSGPRLATLASLTHIWKQNTLHWLDKNCNCLLPIGWKGQSWHVASLMFCILHVGSSVSNAETFSIEFWSVYNRIIFTEQSSSSCGAGQCSVLYHCYMMDWVPTYHSTDQYLHCQRDSIWKLISYVPGSQWTKQMWIHNSKQWNIDISILEISMRAC